MNPSTRFSRGFAAGFYEVSFQDMESAFVVCVPTGRFIAAQGETPGNTIFIVTLSEWIFLWVLLVPYGMGQVTRLASRSSSFLGSRSASTTPFSRLELHKANSRHSDRLTIQMVLRQPRA